VIPVEAKPKDNPSNSNDLAHLLFIIIQSILAYNYIAVLAQLMKQIATNRQELGSAPPKTVERFNKIKEVLVKALGEVHYINTRKRTSPSNSPTSKRRSDESS
jgi:hypothetical protein